jgi:hypothetical protein
LQRLGPYWLLCMETRVVRGRGIADSPDPSRRTGILPLCNAPTVKDA